MLLPGLTEVFTSPTALVRDIKAQLTFLGFKGYTNALMFNDANHFLDLARSREPVKSIPSNKWVPKEYQVRNFDMAPDRKYLVHGQAEYYYPGFEGRSTQWFSFYTDSELNDEEYLESLREEERRKNLYTDGRIYVSFERLGSIEYNARIMK
jgi:hypothetical protein